MHDLCQISVTVVLFVWLPFKIFSKSEQRQRLEPSTNDGAQRPASVPTAQQGHHHTINQMISYQAVCILYCM